MVCGNANGNTASVFSIPQQGFRDSIAASRVMVEGLPRNAQDNNATATLPPGATPSPSGSQAIAFAAADASGEVQFDRMTEEDLLRGLEGLVPPAASDDDGD